MPVYDQRAVSLLQELQRASEDEGVAIKALNAYLQGGGKDSSEMSRLTDLMTAAHDRVMQIYQQMQQFKIAN